MGHDVRDRILDQGERHLAVPDERHQPRLSQTIDRDVAHGQHHIGFGIDDGPPVRQPDDPCVGVLNNIARGIGVHCPAASLAMIGVGMRQNLIDKPAINVSEPGHGTRRVMPPIKHERPARLRTYRHRKITDIAQFGDEQPVHGLLVSLARGPPIAGWAECGLSEGPL